MAISQLLVIEFEWNKVHFVADIIAFTMNANLNSDYKFNFFPGDKNPMVWFVLTLSVSCILHNRKEEENYRQNAMLTTMARYHVLS